MADPGPQLAEPDPSDSLRRQCRVHVSGHPVAAPGEELLRVGQWCRDRGLHADSYGQGELVTGFEARIAALLGKPAGVFMPSGTMAQLIALRIAATRAGHAHVAMHPTAHLELHEERAYAHLHQLRVSLLGPRQRPLLAGDLAACPERLAALLVELPAREIGGRLPSWDELVALSALARSRGIHLQLDGARLWEAREAYAPRTYADIAALFDSVYVSFYKGIGALAGAMLLGTQDFIAEARPWRRRHGGTLVQLHPYVASAAMRFDAQLARMPAWRARALAFAAALTAIDGLVVEPSPPQVNLFHVHFPVPADALAAARDRVAVEDRAWLAQRIAAADVPAWSRIEIYVGDNLMLQDDARLVPLFRKLLALARGPA
jgi:threonine aldolase